MVITVTASLKKQSETDKSIPKELLTGLAHLHHKSIDAARVDFAKLSEKFGGDQVSGRKLKSKTSWSWTTGGDNSSGFDAKAYGKIYSGRNMWSGETASFWVKGKVVKGRARTRSFSSRDGNTNEAYVFSTFGTSNLSKLSVRCVKK